MKKHIRLCMIASCLVALPLVKAADLREGLVSYWPLDTLTVDAITGQNMTPDLGPNTNHLYDNFTMTSGDIVAGMKGSAASFDGTGKYLSRTYTDGEGMGLPVYNARYYTLSMWVKGTGATQQERTVIAEGSNASGNPLFRLSTDNAGAATRTNLLSARIRNNNNNTFIGNTARAFSDQGRSTLMPFDGDWHHIAWVDFNGTARLYVDGQLDPREFRTRLPEPGDIAPANRVTTLNTFSIGATLQAAASQFFSGLIDDVAIWERTLTQEEIDQVRTTGIPTPISAAAPAIVADPVGNTNLLVGEFYSLQGLASGVYPRTYQWYKDGQAMEDMVETNEFGEVIALPIVGSTSNLLVLTNLQAASSGEYSVVIGNSQGSITSAPAVLLVGTVVPQISNLTNGQIAYWPLDEVQGIATPDVVQGQDLLLYQMTVTNLVSGRWGNAIRFYGSGLLERFLGANDSLPANKHRDFTISLWLNGGGAPEYNAGGNRWFAEANNTASTPYFSLANTDNTGQGPLTRARGFLRNDDNQNNSTIGVSGLDILWDPALQTNVWRHVVYVQRWVGGASPVLEATLFVDGVKDSTPQSAFSPRVPLTATITSIGGRSRSDGRGNYFIGLIDDVAVWNRALTAQEIQTLSTNVTPAAPPIVPPLAVTTFKADFPEVVSGDSTTLRWVVNSSLDSLTIDQGVGSVLGNTTNGIGSIVVPNITSSRTFTLTAQRGVSSIAAQTAVAAVSGIAGGWSILDSFQTYNPGPLPITYWSDLMGGSSIENLDGNRMLLVPGLSGTEGQVAVLPMSGFSVNEGEARTLFFRAYVQSDPTLAEVLTEIGLTDKNSRTHADLTGNLGPVVRLGNPSGIPELAVGAYDDIIAVGNPLVQTPRKLELQQVYNIWLDVTNAPFTENSTGDRFSIWVQRVGESHRVLVSSNFATDRDLTPTFLGPNPPLTVLDKLVVAAAAPDSAVYVDDFFISTSGYLDTVPVPWMGPTPPPLTAPAFTPDLTSTPGFFQFTWDAGALMWSSSITGPWRVVPDSYGFFYLHMLDQEDPLRFFRIQR